MVNSVVMGAVLVSMGERMMRKSVPRHGRACPGHPRSSLTANKGVDARDKPGHDVERAKSLLGLAGILHRLEGREFDVVEFAVDLLDLADVDVLHDVAGFRIDRDRAARAFPLHALHGSDKGVAVRLAAALLQRFKDQVDAVIAAHRYEAGTIA